jgi:serine/threonine-protein kinase
VRLDRPVAIKLLPPSKTADPRLRERFLREARTAAKLSHPNIIPIYAVEEIDAFVFFAMAYVEGETLTERVRRRGPLPPSEAARLLRDVAWALAYAHGQGVIHRDVKPDNILLEQASGRILVADFGIAGVVAGAGALAAGEVIGTPEFMSPEQALGEAVDARSDLYSLGIVGYFAFSGTLPFEAEKATEVLAKQVTEPAPPLARATPGVPRRLAQAIDRCLAKDPADRHESTAALAEQLSHALEHRRELPVALRAFVKHDARLDGGGALLYPFALLLGSAFLSAVTGSITVGFSMLAGGITLVPLAVLVSRARGLLRAGFDHGDLGVAFKAEIERGREERAFGHGPGPSPLERVLKAISGIAWTGAVISFVGLFAMWPISSVFGGLFFLSATTGVATGLGVLVLLQRRRDVDSEFWGKLWTGRLGRWLFGLARKVAGAKAIPAPLTHRPTELSIGMAAEQLYEGLPKETRQQLRDLPDVVHRLEDDAQRTRRRLDELQDALGGAKSTGGGAADGKIGARHDRILADLTAERDVVQKRLADAVAALETIRLNLLRLHAGTGSVKSLTTDLGLAREVAKEIDLLLEGQREVERELRS